MSKIYSRQFLVVLNFLIVYIIWGTTYLAIAVGVVEVPPFMMAFFRFSSAGLIILLFVLLRGEKFPSFKTLFNNFIVGSIVMVGGQGLLFWAEQHISSGFASILIAAMPFLFILLDKRHWKLYFNNYAIIAGLIVGFIGVIILFNDKITAAIPEDQIKIQIVASLVVLLGGVFWISGTLYYRSNPSPGSMFSNIGWQLFLSSITCLTISLILDEQQNLNLPAVSTKAWFAIGYLSVAGSIIAFASYTWLLQEIPSALVSTYAYINPIIAVFVGWLLIDETITTKQLLGMFIILVGAVIVNFNKSKVLQPNKP